MLCHRPARELQVPGAVAAVSDGDRGWGYGLSVLDDGSCGWDGGFGTTWLNIPSAVCAELIAAARAEAT